eukprot:TRINITY_DN78563_c0_g1_i1.p1 TRINITY_DN78563_c0_g1~~TRINITY_DN78563_c0_g1_i1.p1  ORF type:complete len:168 (-),score=60.08 TRINITY_DN78563_c0_g1_i1:459-962(-)
MKFILSLVLVVLLASFVSANDDDDLGCDLHGLWTCQYQDGTLFTWEVVDDDFEIDYQVACTYRGKLSYSSGDDDDEFSFFDVECSEECSDDECTPDDYEHEDVIFDKTCETFSATDENEDKYVCVLTVPDDSDDDDTEAGDDDEIGEDDDDDAANFLSICTSLFFWR